jgi:predicted ribosomally synthesized peptide with SipW-like signal peptide
MSKMKKVLLMCTAYVLVAALAIGGTIAYLQDSDSDVNVMTLGNVSIEQHEYERVVNADGSYATKTIDNVTSYVLKDFTQGKPLLPSAVVVSSTPWDSTVVRMTQVDSYGSMQTFLPVTNAQDKFVTVENTGKTDAYIRTLVAIEVGSAEPSLISFSTHLTWEDNGIGTITIDGNNYYLHEFTYTGGKHLGGQHEKGILPAGETSYPNLSQVYIKPEATNEDMVKLDGNGNGTLDILVVSQAVQVAGFADAETALNAGFGDITTTNHPWAEGVNVPVTVSSADDMYAALDAGEKDLVVVGATIDENNFNGHYYKDRNIDFVDCTFTANMNYMYINDATFTNCTFDCGAANSAVHYDELFGDLVFNNCTFKSGKIQIGANKDMTGTVTFNDCVFENTTSTSIWSDNGIRVYSPATFNGCEFNNRVVLAGSNGLSITFDSCTMDGGTPVYYVDNTDGIIRGGNVPVVTIK